MAIKIENGVTTLTPTGWKWFVGAAFTFFLFPPFSLLISLFFVLTGAGVLQRLELSKDGIKIRNWWSEKNYAWSEIADFRVHKVKSGLITAANMVSFTHVNKEGTMMGKAAKLLVGGTHSIPAVGIPAKKLAQLMQAYKQGFVPQASSSLEAAQQVIEPVAPLAPAPARAARQPKPQPRTVPATPRAQNPKPSAQPKFGAKRKASTPLVQDGGGIFGRRRPDSPFSR